MSDDNPKVISFPAPEDERARLLMPRPILCVLTLALMGTPRLSA
jgi:hypothetical protein